MRYLPPSLALVVALSWSMAATAEPPAPVDAPAPRPTVSADDQIRTGLKLAHEGAWQAAIAAFNAALAIDPKSGEALFFRGQAEAAQKDYPAALRSLAAALNQMPHEAAVYEAIGEVHLARGDVDRAADALAIAADLYLRHGGQAEARETIARLREVKPDAAQLAELEARAAGGPALR